MLCGQENQNSKSSWKVCRICLSANAKLYPIEKYNLFKDYEQLISIHTHNMNLPTYICWECSARLSSATRFRNTALRSHGLLEVLHKTTNLTDTLPDISQIDRQKNHLTSPLTQKIFDVNYADYHFTYTEPIQEIQITDIKIEIEDIDDAFYTSSDEVLQLPKVKKKKRSYKLSKVGKLSKTSKTNTETIENLSKASKHDHGEAENLSKVGKNDDGNVDKLSKVADNSSVKIDKRRKPANEVLNEEIFNITDLSYEEQISEIQKRLLSNNYVHSEFKCDQCYKGFLDEHAFECHMNRHTDQSGTYECDVCKIRFKKPHALRNHITSHMQKFSCKKCSYITTRRHAAKLHEEYHNGTRYQCPHCPEDFVKISTYMSHIRIKHPSDFVCPLCGHSFVSAKGLDLHKKLKHRFDEQQVPPDGPNCIECNVQFINNDAMDRHFKLSAKHNDESTDRRRVRPHNVQDRSINKQKTEAKKKRTRRKPEGPISCEQCEMQLPDSVSYYRHFRRTHPDKNRTNYPSMKSKSMCEVCGKMFQSLALLLDHSSTHAAGKQFACALCDKRFQRKYRLIAHARVHAQRQQHACHVCGSVFTTSSNMQRHMVSHTGLKPFKCEMCGKCFKHASEKRVHITYVHLKKPWPKRARGKRKSDKQMATQPVLPAQTDIAPPTNIWPACNDAKSTTLDDKSLYYNIKI